MLRSLSARMRPLLLSRAGQLPVRAMHAQQATPRSPLRWVIGLTATLGAGVLIWREWTKEVSFIMKVKLRKAEIAVDQRNYEHAARLLETVVDDLPSEPTEAHINVLNRLANVYYLMGRWDDALMCFRSCVEGFLLHGRSVRDNAIVEMSIKISNCFSHEGHTEDALAGYDWCVSVMLEKLKSTENRSVEDLCDIIALLGMAQEQYASALEAAGRDADAIPHRHGELFAARELVRLQGSPATASLVLSLNRTAQTLSNHGEHKNALLCLQEAVSLLPAAKLPVDDASVITSNLASVQAKLTASEGRT
eukprot:m.67890 g.67890  ORF g.67890 m.67890 type:complete len:307 (+) comp7470_c0_seq1:63-983(+)